jgi:hypothetical protein
MSETEEEIEITRHLQLRGGRASIELGVGGQDSISALGMSRFPPLGTAATIVRLEPDNFCFIQHTQACRRINNTKNDLLFGTFLSVAKKMPAGLCTLSNRQLTSQRGIYVSKDLGPS